MMKWGGRKPSSSHASPFSWLFKFKQMRVNSDPNPNNVMKQKAKQNSASIASPPPPQYSGGNNGDRFCGGNDNDGAFWTQPVDEESQEDKKSKDTYENVISSSRNAKKHGRRQGTLKLKDGGLEDERKLINDDKKVLMQVDEYDREQEYENIRRRFERKAQQVLEEQLLKLEREAKEVEFASSKAVEEDVLQFESPRTICTPRTHSFVSSAELKNSSLRNILEDRVFSTTNKSFEKTERLSQKKLRQSEELKVKTTEKQKSPHQRNRKPKIRIHSPRMVSKVEVCRIKALEDMRKAAKLKMKKEREEIVEETRPGLDSFAVIKCSLDPKQDFRDSMIEMINEKQISQPEEMEELLACYLTLNADAYHDLIIRVFRQVWFDLSQHGLGIKSNTVTGMTTGRAHGIGDSENESGVGQQKDAELVGSNLRMKEVRRGSRERRANRRLQDYV